MSDSRDEAYLKLKGARERLCIAQMHVPQHWVSDLSQAIRIIDECGSAVAPAQWSRFDQPDYGGDAS